MTLFLFICNICILSHSPVTGFASLYCSSSGLWDAATNYSECLVDIADHGDRGLVPLVVAYTYFILSVISLIFLIICLYIFCSFRFMFVMSSGP